jgi:hypothetical protein
MRKKHLYPAILLLILCMATISGCTDSIPSGGEYLVMNRTIAGDMPDPPETLLLPTDIKSVRVVYDLNIASGSTVTYAVTNSTNPKRVFTSNESAEFKSATTDNSKGTWIFGPGSYLVYPDNPGNILVYVTKK